MNKSFLESFIDYCNNIFPSIDSSVKQSIKEALKQFDINKFNWFSKNNLEGITQGDILDNIYFNYQDENGNYSAYHTKAIVISNSCDIENDDYVLLAPFIPIDTNEFSEEQKQDLVNNRYFGKMCLSYSPIENYYIDFSKIQSFNKKLLFKLLEKNKIKLEYSLSQFGWYFLLTKLTIHFMRMDDHTVFSNRLKGA